MSSGEKEKLCLLNLTASSLQDEAFQFSMVDMLGLKKKTKLWVTDRDKLFQQTDF